MNKALVVLLKVILFFATMLAIGLLGCYLGFKDKPMPIAFAGVMLFLFLNNRLNSFINSRGRKFY